MLYTLVVMWQYRGDVIVTDAVRISQTEISGSYMQYRYVTEKHNYEDYAAGRVILSQSGMTSFPVRLVSEIFQRCASYFPSDQRLRLYDPCCGGGYLLTVLGFLHGEQLLYLHGSDIDAERVALASSNLHLLTDTGLDLRRATLQQLADTYGKQSHDDALQSLDRLTPPNLPSFTWVSDAFQQSADAQSVDLMICDVPYGNVTTWQSTDGSDPITRLLDAQFDTLVIGGIVAIISDKTQRATHPNYHQRQHETLGKRRIMILQKP